MRKIESIFITFGLFAAIIATGVGILYAPNHKPEQLTHKIPDTEYGNFLAAQHAIHVNDFNNAVEFAQKLGNTEYTSVQNTIMLADFLSGRLPEHAATLKDEKNMTARYIYDAYLVRNNKWKDFYNRHKSDDSAFSAPLRIWGLVANKSHTDALKFIDDMRTSVDWKNFVKGQIYIEMGDIENATKHFDAVQTTFLNINDYLYMMSFYTHHDMPANADTLKADFTSLPGGMFMKDMATPPTWDTYAGTNNQLAFSIIQNVSHTQILMYTDLALVMLRFAQITAPDFTRVNNTLDYYIGQFMYNNQNNFVDYFKKIPESSPFYLFAIMRITEKTKDMTMLEEALKHHPLFVPAVNKITAQHIKNGNKRAALRVINNAIDNKQLDEAGRAFFLKNRAHIYFTFGDIKKAQFDLKQAAKVLVSDPEIFALQAKIWAAQNRNIEDAYDYAMALVTKSPTDILAWDTLGCVVAVREGDIPALEIFERVASVAGTCSSVFEHMGDVYVNMGDVEKAKQTYMRAIELADDGFVVVPKIEQKIRKLK